MTHKLYLIDLNARDDNAGTKKTFAQEANKKSSFILGQCPINLCLQEQDDVSADKEQEQKTLSTASASISCSMDGSDEIEMYLFGGFELTASIKSIEIYVTPSESATTTKQEEKYITTCKGIPQRDDENEDSSPSYKFIFVQPGGAKPVNNVRLKLVGTNKPYGDAQSCITIKTLKLKGRLPGDMPKSNKPQANQIPTNDFAANGSAMTAMMAQMRLSSMGQGLPMMQQFSQTHPMPQNHHSFSQQQQHREEQDKSQAEIMSSIVGLGMYLKSSEERTINAMEKLIAGMESRIMERLDALTAKMDAIEQKHNGANADDQE